MSPLGDVGVATTDRQLVVRSWDEWLVAATSIPREEAVGRHLSTLVPAFDERDLRAMRSWHFERLHGERDHAYSMRLNDQFRLVVEIIGSATNKRIRILSVEDYH